MTDWPNTMITTMDDLVTMSCELNPLGDRRWVLNIKIPYSYRSDEQKPTQYSLKETGDSWGGKKVRLAPGFAQQLESFWRKNQYNEPIGGLKFSGIFRRWDDEEGTEFYERFMAVRNVAVAAQNFEYFMQSAEGVLRSIESLWGNLSDEVMGLLSEKNRDDLKFTLDRSLIELRTNILRAKAAKRKSS